MSKRLRRRTPSPTAAFIDPKKMAIPEWCAGIEHVAVDLKKRMGIREAPLAAGAEPDLFKADPTKPRAGPIVLARDFSAGANR